MEKITFNKLFKFSKILNLAFFQHSRFLDSSGHPAGAEPWWTMSDSSLITTTIVDFNWGWLAGQWTKDRFDFIHSALLCEHIKLPQIIHYLLVMK